MLVDAGPLIAIIDQGEPDHRRCVEALARIAAPLVTTWAAFAEAMYLLGGAGGWIAQEALWRLVLRGDLEIASPAADQLRRARDLMERYRNVPMDLADATLVVLAEVRDERRIFTLDSDFRIYRLRGRGSFEVLP
jgi:predicted nucleic acid-binding protein